MKNINWLYEKKWTKKKGGEEELKQTQVKYFCQGLEKKAFLGVAPILFNIAPTST